MVPSYRDNRPKAVEEIVIVSQRDHLQIEAAQDLTKHLGEGERGDQGHPQVLEEMQSQETTMSHQPDPLLPGFCHCERIEA